MTSVLQIVEFIQDTEEAKRRTEAAMATYASDSIPNSLLFSLRSIERRRVELERDFLRETARVGRDVCAYRLLFESDRPSASAFAGTLGAFQHYVSVLYDAHKRGPKNSQRLPAESLAESTFDFNYTFAGSIGIMLSVPNERLLPLVESNLDAAFGSLLEMTQASTPEEFKDLSRRLGVAPIRAMFAWANEHVKGNVGASFFWQRNQVVRAAGVAQVPQLAAIRDVISRTSEEKTRQLKLAGTLQGFYTSPRRFHFRPDSSNVDIHGTYGEALLNRDEPPRLFSRYVATLTRSDVVHFATEREETKYVLDHLGSVESLRSDEVLDEPPQERSESPSEPAGPSDTSN